MHGVSIPNLEGIKIACLVLGFAPVMVAFYLVSMMLIRWANANATKRARRWLVASTVIFSFMVSIGVCAVICYF